MDNFKNDAYYLDKIIIDLQFVISHTTNLSEMQLQNDEVLMDSVCFRLIQISENSNKLTDDFKSVHSDIPWHAIKGLRNRIVHEYGNVNISVIYDTVTDDIPFLLKILKNI